LDSFLDLVAQKATTEIKSRPERGVEAIVDDRVGSEAGISWGGLIVTGEAGGGRRAGSFDAGRSGANDSRF